MSIAYVGANSEMTRTELNAATSELDSILRAVFQGKSFFAYSYNARPDVTGDFYDNPMVGDRFFFGASGLWKVIPQVFGAVTPYDHNTYVTAATALTPIEYDADKKLAICTEASWPLTDSLGVHTVDVGGVDYYLAQEGDDTTRPIAERERFVRLKVAEIVCESLTDLEWDERWTRYHFLRFHNLSLTELTVTLGETEIVIPPLGIKAVRRSYPAGDTWDTSYTYLWKWQSGDSALWSGELPNNVGGLQCYHDWLDYITQANAIYGYAIRDPAVIWTPTTGSPFPEMDPERRVIEYMRHAGRIIAWKTTAGVATEMVDIDPTWEELRNDSVPLKITYDTGTHTVAIDSTDATHDYDAMGVESTVLPRYPTTLPYTIASGALQSVTWPGAYDPTGVGPSYSGNYRTSRADPTTWVTVDTGELPDHTLSDWYTTTVPEASVADALNAFANSDSPTFGTELTEDPNMEVVSDGFRLWLIGTHEFHATTRESPIETASSVPVKFWWTIDKQTVRQSFGVDLSARSGWLHSTKIYGRHLLPQDGYIDGVGDPQQEGNPDVAGTYGAANGRDWTEDRTTHDDPVIKRTEDAPELRVATWTLPVRPKTDVSERVVESAGTDDASIAWYNLNRTDLLANTLTDDDEAGVVMYPILWSHFNHLAMRLNGIKAISPFLFQHVAYWGELDDGTWPAAFSSNVPVTHYATALSSGSRAAELGITVQSITEAGTTGYYVTIADVAAKAEELGLAMAVEGIFAYRTELVPPDVTDQAFWRWTHSNTATAYRANYMTVAESPWAVTRRTISAEGYSIYSPGVNRYDQENTVDLNRSVNFPEIPDGWIAEIGSRLLCSPTKAIGYASDPLTEPRSIEEPPAGAWSTDYEVTEAYDAPIGDPKYLEIGTELEFPADHAAITAAMESSGDDRSEWHITYIPRLLIVRA